MSLQTRHINRNLNWNLAHRSCEEAGAGLGLDYRDCDYNVAYRHHRKL